MKIWEWFNYEKPETLSYLFVIERYDSQDFALTSGNLICQNYDGEDGKNSRAWGGGGWGVRHLISGISSFKSEILTRYPWAGGIAQWSSTCATWSKPWVQSPES